LSPACPTAQPDHQKKHLTPLISSIFGITFLGLHNHLTSFNQKKRMFKLFNTPRMGKLHEIAMFAFAG
jgi:hypothetical protein